MRNRDCDVELSECATFAKSVVNFAGVFGKDEPRQENGSMNTRLQKSASAACSYLVISGHDFRSNRRANLHFIAEELKSRGQTRFFSVGFSQLSKIKRDPRLSLWNRSNRVESWNGIDSYLWRTFLHPGNLRTNALSPLSSAWFRRYAGSAPETLRQWIKDARTIIIESGLGIIFIDLIRRLNPTAQVLYIASDELGTVGCSPFLLKELKRLASVIDGIRVPSLSLVSAFPSGSKLHFIPHGIDPSIRDVGAASPYSGGINLVSVGSMLFDRSFFEIAGKMFPHVIFHIIGGGKKARGLSAPNIVLYGEMPFKNTISYIEHAHAGIAPYEGGKVAPYLADTSMKLMQYGFFGIPSVCPQIVAGDNASRFGYEPGNAESIAAAIHAAIACGHIAPIAYYTWKEVTDRILDPGAYPDTNIDLEIK
jgi:2-beta-glucuronyltransferase